MAKPFGLANQKVCYCQWLENLGEGIKVVRYGPRLPRMRGLILHLHNPKDKKKKKKLEKYFFF